MSGTKRDADAAASPEQPASQTQQDNNDATTSTSTDIPKADRGAAQGPDVKRVRLDESSLLQPSSPTSESVDVTPSSPTNALVKSKNERNQHGNGRGGGRGGRGRDKKKNNNNKGKQRDWSDSRKSKQEGDSATTRNAIDEDGDQEGASADGKPKIPKKKVAMLIGYSGLGYSGSQM